MKLPIVLVLVLVLEPAFADDPSAAETRSALARSTSFFRSVSTNGGYLWRYSEFLTERWGEKKATESQIWVQPPGTPTVGAAFLRAYEVTKDKQYLDAAVAAAEALAAGQLESGGWDYLIDFAPGAKPSNITTFDDNTTQSALRFLMAVAQYSISPRLHHSIEVGLAGLLRAQYPNGAWPQRYDGKTRDTKDFPILKATIPQNWSRDWPNAKYHAFYTFNDNTIRDCILTVLDAHRRYGKQEHLDAAKRAGDFILLAQLPTPQSGWAQQYDFAMQPAWARKFEPPAVSASESSGIIRTLVDLYLATGDEKYLAPIPSAIDWLKHSEIAPKTWARFYEVGSNKPLYFTKDYKLTHNDDDLPTHYSFKSSYGVQSTIGYYEEVKQLGHTAYLEKQKPNPLTAQGKEKRRAALAPRIRAIITTLDEKGRWLTNNRIESKAFVQNINLLCDYLEVAE